jgi:hypothetical protein
LLFLPLGACCQGIAVLLLDGSALLLNLRHKRLDFICTQVELLPLKK